MNITCTSLYKGGSAQTKRVKVCCVSLFAYHLFSPLRKTMFGGAEVQLYYLATELAKDPRFELYFVVGDFGQPEIEVKSGVTLYKCFNLTRGAKRSSLFYVFFRFWKIFRFLRILREIDADIYIQRASGRITGMMGLFCKMFHKKFIYMVAHDTDVERGDILRKGRLSWMIFKKGLLSADLIICQHTLQAQALRSNYGKESIVRRSAHVIRHPPPINVKHAILWVARCEDWKQPELFIEAARRFPQNKFIMVCQESTDAHYFAGVRERAAAVSNLDFVEYVPFKQIDDYFAGSKIFVNTSLFEGFPNTFIQAAKNKTVILSLNADPEGILEKYKMGLCARGDMSKLSGYLEELLANEKLWREMAENAYRYTRNNHDLNKIIEADKKMLLDLTTR